jgi:hypothetical protein
MRAGVHAVQVRDPTGPLDLMDALYWLPFLVDAFETLGLNTSDFDNVETDPFIYMPDALNVTDLEEVAEIVDGAVAPTEEHWFCTCLPTTFEVLTLFCRSTLCMSGSLSEDAQSACYMQDRSRLKE